MDRRRNLGPRPGVSPGENVPRTLRQAPTKGAIRGATPMLHCREAGAEEVTLVAERRVKG